MKYESNARTSTKWFKYFIYTNVFSFFPLADVNQSGEIDKKDFELAIEVRVLYSNKRADITWKINSLLIRSQKKFLIYITIYNKTQTKHPSITCHTCAITHNLFTTPPLAVQTFLFSSIVWFSLVLFNHIYAHLARTVMDVFIFPAFFLLYHIV